MASHLKKNVDKSEIIQLKLIINIQTLVSLEKMFEFSCFVSYLEKITKKEM